MGVTIRKFELNDCASTLELIHNLAIFRGSDVTPEITIYDLIRDGFSKNKFFSCFVAVKNSDVIGFVMFYKTYSIFGKSLIIEEVYVNEENKKQGIALSLFSKVLDFLIKNNINQLEWGLLEKYQSQEEFYNQINAKILWDTHIYTNKTKSILKYGAADVDYNSVGAQDGVSIRIASSNDAQTVLTFIKAIAKSNNTPTDITLYDIISDGFSKNTYFKVFIAEFESVPIGMLLFYDSYSANNGRSINIEELYIKSGFETLGIGKILKYRLFNYAKTNKVVRIEEAIKDNNNFAIKRTKAFDGKRVEGKRIVRISKEAIINFLK